MKSFSILFSLAFVLFSGLVYGQKIKTKEGSLGVLKSETSVNIVFTYDGIAVGKFKQEADYIAEKKAEYNKKEAGKGDKWAEAWIGDRKRVYEPQFLEQFLEKTGLKVDKNARYTMEFHTTFIEPGFNVGVMRKNAYIDAVVTVTETASPDKKVAVLEVDNAPGRDAMGVDFDTSWRISEAYAKAGKSLAGQVKK